MLEYKLGFRFRVGGCYSSPTAAAAADDAATSPAAAAPTATPAATTVAAYYCYPPCSEEVPNPPWLGCTVGPLRECVV